MNEVLILKELKGIETPKDIFKNIKVNINYDQENFIVIGLNTKNVILGSKVLFIGGLNECLIDPKVIFKYLFELNSNSFIVVHNHPSGNLKPSSEDEEGYKKLKACGEMLQLKCLDSIIINKSEFYSLGCA